MDEKFQTHEFFENEEIFRVLFDNSANGIFLVDPNTPKGEWPILLCNDSAAKMYGYAEKRSLIHRSFESLFNPRRELDPILPEIHAKEAFRLDANHSTIDGGVFPVSCDFRPVRVKGMALLVVTVSDTTMIVMLQEMIKKAQEAQEKFQTIFDNSPDGIVIIDPTQGIEKWPIEDCNQSFIEMNGYQNREELIGQDIRLVSQETAFPNDEKGNHRKAYYEHLQKEPLRGEETHRKKDGSTFPIKFSTCLVNLNGRERVLGIDRDTTEENILQRDMDDLRKDVGRTFHNFTGTLLQAQLAISASIKALDPDPFVEGNLPSMEFIWSQFTELRITFISNLNRILDSLESDFQKEALVEIDRVELKKMVTIVMEIENVIVEQRVPVIRRAANRVIDVLERIEKGRIRKELTRDAMSCAKQIEQLTCLVALHQIRDRIIDADYLVRDLRERIIKNTKANEDPSIFEFWDLVKDAIEGLSEYANYKGVAIRKHDLSNKAQVKVVRHDIVRAINNLLHNAIKYSWWRDQNAKPWISITCFLKEGKVYVEIRDFGVPIPREEIEKDLIFQLGYRGMLAGQRGRLGTGIGLSDSREMARRYKGEVTLTSRPAPQYADQDDISVPHIKTASLCLPIYKRY